MIARKMSMAVMIVCLVTPIMALAGAAQNSKGPEGGYKTALLADQGTLLEKMVAEQHETNVLLKKLLKQEKLTNSRFVPFKKTESMIAPQKKQ
ncbi:hypothetical protein HF563_08225 [Acidithiobacillus ferridurans]|uniref:hypothetical protein n=1 Tax=Acidithiobacillus ferridurans TaxID=1232575 RepID=UPI001C07D04F|nr:hypothetical protein [Acidithiobacillus ferridurans]MBU2719359.1 hypothetical protein [Acidithiobacillus ferridurans]MBU2733469.1 hypothetical protein [Acidithiobacillus ferridurans]